MLTAVACSCVRSGRKMSAPVAQLSLLSAKTSPRCVALIGVRDASQHRPPRFLTPASWFLPSGPSLRCVSQSKPSPGPPSSPEDGENFGSLSADISSRRSFRKSGPDTRELGHPERDPQEDEGEEEEEVVRRPRSRNTPYWYFLQCKKLIKEKKLQEALELFSRDMLQVEKLQPQEFNYTILIGGCGRAGQLKQAFRLYNDMKKRGLEAVDATYTALFNACAQSPSKQAGLQQALKLEQELLRKNYALSTITYHALLKTHAFTNHLQACIHTLREMLQKGHAVTPETFHYLLMGCLKDKEAGFRMALQVWRQMLKSGIRPDSKNYTLLLRTARDCGMGDPALASGVLLTSDWEGPKASNVKRESRRRQSPDRIDIDLLERQLFIEPGLHRDGESTQLIPVSERESSSLQVEPVNSSAPNLLDLFEGRECAVVSLGAVSGAHDRLALIGGAEGFLGKMEAQGFSPDLRTLTLLADTVEPGFQSLQLLLRAAKKHRVKLDAAFFNSVIRRAARAGDMEAAQGVLSVMRQRHVSVDVQTFGSLALGCKHQKDALQLLQDMEGAGLRPNVHVFSALIGRASQRLDYVYLKTLLKMMSEMEVWPNEVIIKQLEFASQYPPNYNQFKSRNNYLVQIDGFRGYYQEWLKFMPAKDEEAEVDTETEAAELETEAADGLTSSQRNQKAAARRYYSRKDKAAL